MTKELTGHLYDEGDGYVCIRSDMAREYLFTVAVPLPKDQDEVARMNVDILKLKPGAKCRLVLEDDDDAT